MALNLAASRRPVVGVVATLVILLVVWLAVRGAHDEFATLTGHHEGVYSLALSPDGKVAASGGGDGAVCLWDLQTLRETALIKGHVGRILAVAWSPDGESVASGGEDKTIHLGPVRASKELPVFAKVPKTVEALAFSSDGKYLAAAVDQLIFYWKLQNREMRVLTGHKRTITGLAFLPGSMELATFAGDSTVRIWNLERGRLTAQLPGPIGHCYGMTVSADGKLLACVGGARVHLFDLEKRQVLDPIEPQARIICGVAFSPDGKTLAIGSQDKQVLIWDLVQRKERVRLNGHQYAVGAMAFLPDGQTLVTSSHDSSLKLWKVQN